MGRREHLQRLVWECKTESQYRELVGAFNELKFVMRFPEEVEEARKAKKEQNQEKENG